MHLFRSRSLMLMMSFAIALTTLCGCGGAPRPPMGYVTGTVTVDGEAIGGAIVSFKPDVGRPATGITSDEGFYELKYIHNEKGCKVGRNTVVFYAPTSGSMTKTIPPKYLVKSDLVVEVENGNNVFDFDLESDPKEIRKVGIPEQRKSVID